MKQPQSENPERLLLCADGVAKVLSLSKRTIWRMVSAGELPAPVRIGRASRWRRSDLERFVDALQPGNGEVVTITEEKAR